MIILFVCGCLCAQSSSGCHFKPLLILWIANALDCGIIAAVQTTALSCQERPGVADQSHRPISNPATCTSTHTAPRPTAVTSMLAVAPSLCLYMQCAGGLLEHEPRAQPRTTVGGRGQAGDYLLEQPPGFSTTDD